MKVGQKAPFNGALVPMKELRKLTGDSLENERLRLEMRDNANWCKEQISDQSTYGILVYGGLGLLLGVVARGLVK